MKESLIYPGEYMPPANVEVLLAELILSGKESGVKIHPKINIDEYGNYYKLEIRMPGIKRNEVVVYINDKFLSVAAVQKKPFDVEEKNLKIHEFDAACFHRHIFLPGNADTAFVSAEFKKGILHLHIPKTDEPLFLKPRQVAIY